MSPKFTKNIRALIHGLIIWLKNFRGGVTLAIAAFFIIFPFLNNKDYFLGPFMLIMIYTIFAASWDFLAGFTGQGSFGHVIFLGIGVYSYSHFVATFALPWWIALLLGALIVVLMAFLLGLPLQRMSGPYFALGTLAIGVIIQILWHLPTMDFISGGTMGIYVGEIAEDNSTVYFITMAFMVMSLVSMIMIGKSKMGTIFKAIRDDEIGAKASGINTLKYKLIALLISAFFAGIAGGLYAQRTGGASAANFNVLVSFYPIIMVMIGGLTTISGSLLGAFIFVIYDVIIKSVIELPIIMSDATLQQFLKASPMLIFALIIMLILRFAPDGLMKPTLDKLQKVWDLIIGK